ncbi:MAG: flavin reductase family protein [Candidatus Cloacimonetes bacterium]|jgi:flavin reductase (DIM6/NTAB) family NADH-FMN oxidoreductase RutF|nr:flavin reductase family protein [Candidatus Cloacimonadota bacterium]MBT6994962.1 flavin reductase family protein [Candidatus Cloacimonadota bacterium]MBT7469423.1 flavin reductase family protein [Candidatus Cloacimonadota bacterium]
MKRIDIMEVIKATKHPAKIAIAVVKCDGKFNLITIEWFMRTSQKSPMFAISIGKTRFSHKCLQKYRFFNLVILSQKMKNVAVLCGTKSGNEIDKLENVNWFAGKLAKLPILKDAVANFECKIVSQIKSGDHTIFVGEVKHSWLQNEKILTYLEMEK